MGFEGELVELFAVGFEVVADFDVGWETLGVNIGWLDPILRHSALGRAAQKIKYRGELFPLRPGNPRAEELMGAFQRDPATGTMKGIIAMRLEDLT